MNQIDRTIRRPLAALAMVCFLMFFTGCGLFEPTGGAALSTPDAAHSATPGDTATPQPPSPAPTNRYSSTAEPSGEQAEEANGAGAYTITADTNESQKTYYSTQPDENALRVENGAVAGVDGARVEKMEGDSTSLENTVIYGLNAALLVRANAQLLLTNSEIFSAALGAGGVFAYGGTLQIQGGSIRAVGDSSYAVSAASGGVISLYEINLSTLGEMSPAVRAAAEGAVIIEGGITTSNGASSPVLSAAGSIDVKNATLRANHSEIAAINGGSVMLTDCAVTGRMGDVFSADVLIKPYAVALYRDANPGGQTSSFSMTRGALTALTGDLFYATNTTANIYLEGVALSIADGRALLRVSGNDGSRGWGEAGNNGADCTLIVQDQVLLGDIVVDAFSTVSVTLRGESTYTGTVNEAGTARAAEVTLEDGATWTLTGNAYLTSFTGRVSDIETNGYAVYVNGALLTN